MDDRPSSCTSGNVVDDCVHVSRVSQGILLMCFLFSLSLLYRCVNLWFGVSVFLFFFFVRCFVDLLSILILSFFLKCIVTVGTYIYPIYEVDLLYLTSLSISLSLVDI